MPDFLTRTLHYSQEQVGGAEVQVSITLSSLFPTAEAKEEAACVLRDIANELAPEEEDLHA